MAADINSDRVLLLPVLKISIQKDILNAKFVSIYTTSQPTNIEENWKKMQQKKQRIDER